MKLIKKIKELYQKKDKLLKSQFFKFLVIGAFCTLQNIVWLYVLTTMLGIHYLISTIILMLTVNTLGFYLNKRYTFGGTQKTTIFKLLNELVKYHLVMISSFITILILMYIFVEIFKIWYILANLIISLGMSVYNFVFHKKWTFK